MLRRFSGTSALTGALLTVCLQVGGHDLSAQGVPTVQQGQFRSQWVGEQVDQIPLGSTVTPLNGLGAVVGSLQTQDEVQREVEASLAGVEQKSPFAFKPSLGVGWQFSNQGTQSQGNSSGAYAPGSSPFIAPTVALLYDREHGPWSVSAGYSAGYRYYSNQDFVANGTGSTRNPFSQTALLKVMLQMSRYIFDALATASSGTGYDTTSASFNLQTTLAANMGMKYLLSNSSAVAAKAGYTLQNSYGSTATPNNNTTLSYANLSPIYDLSDKTHLSALFGVGQSAQSLQSGTAVTGNTALTSSQVASRQYAQALGKVKYDITGKITADVALGARYVASSNIQNPIDDGILPAWAVGFSYTPTAKTSVTLSAGQQGADIRPEFNLLLDWKPREKTSFTLGLSQGQSFANALSAQYLVTRGIVGTVRQKFFSSVDCTLSGGYATQQYLSLSSDQTAGQTSSQLPQSYYIVNATVNWKIRDWVSLSNTATYNTGQQIQAALGTTQPQLWYTIALNFTL